jgi:hypothetical protein
MPVFRRKKKKPLEPKLSFATQIETDLLTLENIGSHYITSKNRVMLPGHLCSLEGYQNAFEEQFPGIVDFENPRNIFSTRYLVIFRIPDDFAKDVVHKHLTIPDREIEIFPNKFSLASMKQDITTHPSEYHIIIKHLIPCWYEKELYDRLVEVFESLELKGDFVIESPFKQFGSFASVRFNVKEDAGKVIEKFGGGSKAKDRILFESVELLIERGRGFGQRDLKKTRDTSHLKQTQETSKLEKSLSASELDKKQDTTPNLEKITNETDLKKEEVIW